MKGKIKFYADTPRGETNKLFTFNVKNRIGATNAIERFKKHGFNIRAAWFETSRNGIAGYSNQRIA
jgi:hypothetical protein